MATVLRVLPAAVALLLALGVATGCAGEDDRSATPGTATAGAAVATTPFLGVAANTLGWGADVGRAQDFVTRAGIRMLREELSWYLVERPVTTGRSP